LGAKRVTYPDRCGLAENLSAKRAMNDHARGAATYRIRDKSVTVMPLAL
jgi:hypothetical protein